MEYNEQDIETAYAIFYALMKKGELHGDQQKRSQHYDNYVNNNHIQLLLAMFARSSDSIIRQWDNGIYLIPNDTNNFLGFSSGRLRTKILGANASEDDYLLVQFAMMVLIKEFYADPGSRSDTQLSREFILLSEYAKIVGEELKSCISELEDDNSTTGNYKSLWEKYDSLQATEEITKGKMTTKEGFLYKLLTFLKKQRLITIATETNIMIFPTPKLTMQVHTYLLDTRNKENILKTLLGENESEPN